MRAVALVALVVARVATAAPSLDVEAEVRAGEAPGLRLAARNTGDEVAGATPEVLYRHQTLGGDLVRLAPGARHEWSFSLPPPEEPGTFPVTARVRWPGGAVPVVAVLAGPGAPPSEVVATLDAEPMSRIGSVRLRLENRGARAAAGRVALVLPGELRTEPESQPAEVPAHGETTVPMTLDASRARPGTRPAVWAVFEYEAAGVHHAVVAKSDVLVVVREGERRPLVVGGTALVLAVAVLAVALRRAARSR